MTSTEGKVMDGVASAVGKESCAATAAGNTASTRAATGNTCLGPRISFPASCSSAKTIKAQNARRRFPDLRQNFSRLPREFFLMSQGDIPFAVADPLKTLA